MLRVTNSTLSSFFLVFSILFKALSDANGIIQVNARPRRCKTLDK